MRNGEEIDVLQLLRSQETVQGTFGGTPVLISLAPPPNAQQPSSTPPVVSQQTSVIAPAAAQTLDNDAATEEAVVAEEAVREQDESPPVEQPVIASADQPRPSIENELVAVVAALRAAIEALQLTNTLMRELVNAQRGVQPAAHNHRTGNPHPSSSEEL